jgi:hypothetical protein
MRSFWRLFVTCMLLVAVPLQGMAAVGMVGCSPGPSAVEPASHHSPGATDHAHHAAPTPAPDAAHPGADAGQDDCSQCAPCCFAAMLLSSFELPAPAWHKHLVRALAEVSYPSAHVPGLDRPPRAFPA